MRPAHNGGGSLCFRRLDAWMRTDFSMPEDPLGWCLRYGVDGSQISPLRSVSRGKIFRKSAGLGEQGEHSRD